MCCAFSQKNLLVKPSQNSSWNCSYNVCVDLIDAIWSMMSCFSNQWKSLQNAMLSSPIRFLRYFTCSIYHFICDFSAPIKERQTESPNTPHLSANSMRNVSETFLECVWKKLRFEWELMIGCDDIWRVSIIDWWLMCATSIIIPSSLHCSIIFFQVSVSHHCDLLHAASALSKFRTKPIDLTPLL